MKTLITLTVLIVAGCSGQHNHELAQTSKSDPIWVLNSGKWTFDENALTTPLGEPWK